MFKLNVDEFCKIPSIKSEARDIFRDHKGKWIAGFMKDLGVCSALESELWSILIGLELTQQANISHLVVESDSIIAVEAINRRRKLFGNCSHLVTSIHNFL